ncbi:MAG: hypothetical protein BMS9Abin07_1275 [Acidimicrobiia bacterium]|nr:MAG: hypothetical protein BMS9Abin07_1275 [Acidimicrobiia bacterium]
MSTETRRPQITVTPDGPYELSGDVPITPKRVVTSERGEPLAWATADQLAYESPVLLCRCGESQSKPFCDNSHLTVNFDGTEAASDGRFFDQSKTYEGTGITVHRVGGLCAHASFCANRSTDWHQMLPDTGDSNVRTQLIGMVEHCPSGALVYEIDGEIIETDLPLAVSPVEDGPLFVTGGVSIVRSDGVPLETRNRVTLCRCGRSENKPMCDGAHIQLGFEAKDSAAHSSEASVQAQDPETIPGVYQRIVVAVGPSTTSETYGVAAMFAKAASKVTLVYAGAAGPEADRLLSGALDQARQAGIPEDRLASELRTESPATSLAGAAVDAGAGLMILGRGGDRVARLPRQVAHRSPCDVLLVAPRGADRPDHYRRVLIATDGSVTADRAAGRGYDLARTLDASVTLVFVGHPATGELIVADTVSTCGSGVTTDVRLLEGSPAKRILETAGDVDADLIVVGNKGMTGVRILPGESVPGAVLKGARGDVLLSRTVRQLESELAPGDGGVIERNGEQMAAFVDDRGELHLMSARCPHMGCLVAWNPSDKTFDCPCHGSRFGPLGEVVHGPASKPLRPA